MSRQLNKHGAKVMKLTIKRQDTIKATSYDKEGHVISSIYDSGFSRIDQVISALTCKGSGWLKTIKEVEIINEETGEYGWYTASGRRK